MRPNLMDIFQESSRGATVSRATRRLSDLMVVAEVALALMLLVSAGLLIRSFIRLTSIDPGYRTSGIVATHIVLPARYAGPVPKRQFFSDLVDRVKQAAWRRSRDGRLGAADEPAGRAVRPAVHGRRPVGDVAVRASRARAIARCMPDYFETMGIALKKGRVFDAFDGRENGPKVAIVNESVVRRYFGAVDPLDKLVRMPMAGDLHIVGVVADIRHDGLQASAEAEVFVPYDQFPLSQMQVVISTTARCRCDRPAASRGNWPPWTRRCRSRRCRGSRISLSASIAQPRFNMTLLAALALCAALLAAVGVYGVVTYSVTRRTAEIGVRMALGADAGRTFRLVVFGALKVVLVGVALGLGGAVVAGRSLRNILFGVPPIDPVTFVACALGVVAIGLVAASVPALRALANRPCGSAPAGVAAPYARRKARSMSAIVRGCWK